MTLGQGAAVPDITRYGYGYTRRVWILKTGQLCTDNKAKFSDHAS